MISLEKQATNPIYFCLLLTSEFVLRQVPILVTQHMAAKIWRANGDEIEAVVGYGVL